MNDPGTQTPYADEIDLQRDVVDLVRLLVRRLIRRQPPGARPSPDGLSSFAIRAEEAAAFAASAGREEPEEDLHALQELGAGLEAQWRRIQRRLELAAAEGIDLPLERLRGFFGLSPEELQVILALFAPELDGSVQRAYRYAWNDFTRKRIEVGFLLDLLAGDERARDRLRRSLAPDGRLRRHRLVVLGPELRDGEELSFLDRTLRLPNRVVDFLRGEDRLDEALLGLCRQVAPAHRLADLLVPESVLDGLRVAIRQRGRGGTAPVVLLLGPQGVGKRSLVEAVANDLGRPFLVADLDAIFEDTRPTEDLIALVLREANLMGALLHLPGTAALPQELSPAKAARIAALLEGSSTPVFLGLTVLPKWLELELPALQVINVPLPSPEEREQLWRRALPKSVRLGRTVDLAEVAQRYSLTGGCVLRAAETAARRAMRRPVRTPSLSQDDLETAARAQITHMLGTLATRILPRFTWQDFILPDEEMSRLREIVAFARNRAKVFEEWGFESKVPYGRGLSALFSGPPGTGKTMAAGIISRELGLELFKVDLSRVVDRYIGETEKNLGRVFDEATESHAVLLFDEADSLFSKRTAVHSATDRYANLEVNYLLQRMEDFEGVTILTTNFDAGFDDAFRRRIKFRITFPFPDAADRERLWKAMFPKEAKLASRIDWKKLAGSFEMSGGHIKNAVLRAAFLAAERGSEQIDTEILLETARFEYLEMGKLVRD